MCLKSTHGLGGFRGFPSPLLLPIPKNRGDIRKTGGQIIKSFIKVMVEKMQGNEMTVLIGKVRKGEDEPDEEEDRSGDQEGFSCQRYS